MQLEVRVWRDLCGGRDLYGGLWGNDGMLGGGGSIESEWTILGAFQLTVHVKSRVEASDPQAHRMRRGGGTSRSVEGRGWRMGDSESVRCGGGLRKC